MYRLTIIASPKNAQPARGSSFKLIRGENSIGRNSENQIVLRSGNVSKRHCVLVVNNDSIQVKDQGSSNGTFVNGELTRAKKLKAGDRISVGEFTFEVKDGDASSLLPFPAAAPSNVLPFPAATTASQAQADPMPTTPLGKLNRAFEKFVMPYFYALNERYDWKMIGIAFIGLFVVLNLLISISPLMEAQEHAITREIVIRARLIAREISERNTPYFATKQETKSELGSIGNGSAVKLAVIVDMDGKVISPASNAGEVFTRGVEAIYAADARKLYANGEEKGLFKKADDTTVVAIEPIKVLNPRLGKNVVVAMTIVSVDTARASPGLGELSAVYANALILSILVGILVFYILYRVTIRPFELMNRQIDQAMRGERHEVKSPVHFEEIEPLWTIVDAVVKRLPRGDGTLAALGSGSTSQTIHDFLPQFQSFGSQQTQLGVAVLDGMAQVAFLNSPFEEITGIRSDSAMGQSIESSSRDQAFTTLLHELIARAAPGGESVGDEFDFSGVQYRLQAMCFGTIGSPVCYLITMERVNG